MSESEFTGEVSKFKGLNSNGEWSQGKVANVTFVVGSDKFTSRAVAVPEHTINWTAVMSIDMNDRDLLMKTADHVSRTTGLPQAETNFLPPAVTQGTVRGAVLVSEGEVVEQAEAEEESVVEPKIQSEGSEVHDSQAMEEKSDGGQKEEKGRRLRLMSRQVAAHREVVRTLGMRKELLL